MTTSAQTLITTLCNRMDLDSTDATNARPDMLRQLNISQKAICQDYSLRFLVTNGSLSVVSSSVAVPSTLDPSKAMTIGRSAGDGEVEYVPTDEWFRTRVDLYGEGAAPTTPTHYTVADVGGTLTFLFLPTGLSATLPYLAQKLVTDMTDSNSSFSVVPSGWEDTLLLDHAEMELRRLMNEPNWDALAARVNDKLERLYSSYRTTKEQAMTDREQKERKIAKSQLSEESP